MNQSIIVPDTNSILDALLERNSNTSFFERIDKGDVVFSVPNIVYFELEWVLRSVYKKSKAFIISFLKSLLIHPSIRTKNKEIMQKSLVLYEETASISFVDAMILAEALENNAVLQTQDKKLKKIYQRFSS